MLRNRIEDAGVHRNITVGSSELYSVKALLLFYERRMFQPAWMDNDGPRPHVKHLIDAICRADQEGLRPEDYHLDEISGILPEKKYFKWRQPSVNPRQLTDLELLMTDAFLLYGSDLLSGRINPETIDPEYFTKQNIRVFQGWGAETKEIDPKTVNWSAVTPKTFTFRLRQDPGPQNAWDV